MSRIKGTDTKPEVSLRKTLWSLGVRYRLGTRIGRLRPDLVFKKSMLAIYVDGCFWHGCPAHYTPPRSRAGFWSAKLRANVLRDIEQTERLRQLGWRVLRLWEHEVVADPLGAADRIKSLLSDKRLLPRYDRQQVIAAEPMSKQVRLELVRLDGEGSPVHISRDLIMAKVRSRKSDSL